ncbi:hypothetical protein BDZ94DRAFT_1176561 [Collybia nuda]|uniref:CFEM domain-containing protein n=1 Tax=Collybia nuda TaxID=64659 RepID=A0A9P6C9B4_9AGAR|nr:hypothetical protein BDZ94DRAFT_1176561 [Collybia nuda]
MHATKTQIFTAVFLAAAAVNAQSASDSAAPPTGTGGISPCIIGCVQPAATANGCDFTDPKCVCASAQFQADARKCLEDTCTPEEVTTALGLQQAQCAGST